MEKKKIDLNKTKESPKYDAEFFKPYSGSALKVTTKDGDVYIVKIFSAEKNQFRMVLPNGKFGFIWYFQIAKVEIQRCRWVTLN